MDFRGKGGFKRKGEGVSIKKREVVKVGRPGEGGLRSRRGEEERVLVGRHFDQNLHSHLDQKLVSLASGVFSFSSDSFKEATWWINWYRL